MADEKPKIYAFCAAGCAWETVHRAEMDEVAAGVAVANAKLSALVDASEETTAGYLAELEAQRAALAENLTTKGIVSDATESFTALVPKVLDIQVGEEIKLQTKTVTPTTSQQTIKPSSGYDGLSQVTVNAIQTETTTITANGTYTPTSGKYFSSVTVNIPSENTVQYISESASSVAVKVFACLEVSYNYYVVSSGITDSESCTLWIDAKNMLFYEGSSIPEESDMSTLPTSWGTEAADQLLIRYANGVVEFQTEYNGTSGVISIVGVVVN